MKENGHKIFEHFRQGEEEVCIACQSGQMERAVERSGGGGKKVSRYDAGSESIE